MSRLVPLGRVARLVVEPADESAPAVAAEMIEGGVGRLVPDHKIDVDGLGSGFRAGDVLFGKLRPYLAKVWLADQRGRAIGDLHVYRPNAELAPNYLRYCLLADAFISPVTSSTFGAKMPRASWDFIKTVRLYIPPLTEQRAIADYLDRETAKIDTLIEKQTTMIERLRERRSAVINKAVWASPHRLPLRWLVDSARPMTYGILQAGEPVAGGVPYIGPSDIPGEGVAPRRSTLRTTSTQIDEQYARSRVRGGDVVVSIGPAYGRVMVATEELRGANLTQDTVRVALVTEKADARFIVWVLASPDVQTVWDRAIQGATFRRLNLGTLGRTPIPIPPLPEQRETADYLDRETAKIDTLIAKVERHIELAKERRAALITAAVTGQIDVTNTTQSGDAA